MASGRWIYGRNKHPEAVLGECGGRGAIGVVETLGDSG